MKKRSLIHRFKYTIKYTKKLSVLMGVFGFQDGGGEKWWLNDREKRRRIDR